MPLHQEPGLERSSSRTRGAHLASDGPSPQLPTGSLVLLHAPLLVPSDATARGKKNRELPLYFLLRVSDRFGDSSSLKGSLVFRP